MYMYNVSKAWIATLFIVVTIAVFGVHQVSAQEPSAIMQCLNSTIKDGHIQLTYDNEGTGDVISRNEWVMRCTGVAAKRAWDQFFAFRENDPIEGVDPNGAPALVLKTGSRSRCFKLIKNPDGTPATADRVVCDISLDLLPIIQMSGVLRQD